MHVKKNDIVMVLAGDDRGSTGKVLQVYPQRNKVLVEGVNKVYKHVRPSRRNPQGGRLSKEMPLAASNVLFYCGTCRKGRRLGRRYTNDGSKERYCKKCGTGHGLLSKPDPKYARTAAPPAGAGS
jgi:large subunit ribosomal protein L24